MQYLKYFLLVVSISGIVDVDAASNEEIRGAYTVNNAEVHATLKQYRGGRIRYQLNSVESGLVRVEISDVSLSSISESGRVLFVTRYGEGYRQYSEIYLNGIPIFIANAPITSRTSFADRHAVAYRENESQLRVVRFSDDGYFDSRLIERGYASVPSGVTARPYSARGMDYMLRFTPDFSMIYTNYDTDSEVIGPPREFHYLDLETSSSSWVSMYFDDTDVRSSAIVDRSGAGFILTQHRNIIWNNNGEWRQMEPAQNLRYAGIYEAIEPGYFIGVVYPTRTYCVLDSSLEAKVCLTNDTENSDPIFRYLNKRYITGVQFLDDEILLGDGTNRRAQTVDVSEYLGETED